MREKIEDHYSDAEIFRLEMEPETSRWLERTQFLSKEMHFLKSLLFHNFTAKINPDLEFSKSLLKRLDKKHEENNFQTINLRDFRNKLEGFRECDDIQCENIYLGEYLLLKKVIYEHFGNVRKIKSQVYEYLLNGMEK